MNCIDLIMELSKLPPDMEVVYGVSQDENGFKMVIVSELEEIITDGDIHYVMLNPGFNE